MKYAIIDYRASAKTVDALEKLNFSVIKTPQLTTLYTTICGHSDIMVFKAQNDEIIVEPTVFKYFSNKLTNIEVVAGNTILNEKYPFDIAYNAALVGKKLICNEQFTDDKILDFANRNDIKIVNTKQGYAKCSICIISDEAIITSDKNIQIAAEKNKIDVLMVDDTSIKLNGFEHGFIGGATGLISKNILAVNGDINYHKDCNRIVDFCKSYGIEVISLNNEQIDDIGSIITL